MKIGIDIDDTITDTKDIMIEYIENYTDFKVEEMHDLPASFWETFGERIYQRVNFKPGVKESFAFLRSIGCEIIIITAREYRTNYDIVKLTEDMFKRNEINYDKIIYHSIPKGPDAQKENIDLFIDDLEYNLESVGSYGIDCIKIVNDYNNDNKYRQFNNWNDLTKYIELWGREKNG